MTSRNTANLCLMIILVLFHEGMCWKYCDKWDEDRDKFGVSKFAVYPQSLETVVFKLKGTPEVNIGRGGGDLVPKIMLKIYESNSGKEIYSETKDLCDHTDCSLKAGRKAKVKVEISDLKPKLKRDIYYTGEMTVIEKCGKRITCVLDKFCIAKSAKPKKDKGNEIKTKENNIDEQQDNGGNIIIFDENNKKGKHKNNKGNKELRRYVQ